LHPDLLFVTAYEREVMAKAGVKPRPAWLGSASLEQHVLHGPGPKVGVILLPQLNRSDAPLPADLLRQLGEAVQHLRSTTRLVVAMSPWGYAQELELLKSAGPLPDVLLGSGPGIGLAGQLSASGKTAWVRAFAQGKSITRIEIMALPEHNSTFKWTEEKNIRMTLFGLTDHYPEEPHMLALMQSAGTD
jgi:hypothetical protein